MKLSRTKEFEPSIVNGPPLKAIGVRVTVKGLDPSQFEASTSELTGGDTVTANALLTVGQGRIRISYTESSLTGTFETH